MAYQFLLFDLDNTLFDFDLAEDIAISKLLAEQNVENLLDYKTYYKKINQVLWHQLDLGEISRDYLVNNRFRLLFEHFDRTVDGRYLAKRYEDILGQCANIIAGADELLCRLSKRYKIYAITNGLTSIQENRLKHSSIGHYFDKVFISETIGYQKPQTEFFDYVAKHIENFGINKPLVIGDNLLADIYGANRYGIDSVWCNFKQMKNQDTTLATYVIKNYKELEAILGDTNE